MINHRTTETTFGIQVLCRMQWLPMKWGWLIDISHQVKSACSANKMQKHSSYKHNMNPTSKSNCPKHTAKNNIWYICIHRFPVYFISNHNHFVVISMHSTEIKLKNANHQIITNHMFLVYYLYSKPVKLMKVPWKDKLVIVKT